MEKKSIFNKCCWSNWQPVCKNLKIDTHLSPCKKLKSKWIKDLNIKPDTLNFLEDKVGMSLKLISTGVTLMAQHLRSKIDKWDLVKLKSSCKARDTVNRTKQQPKDWEEIFTMPTSNRELISKIYKELKKLTTKKSKQPN